MNPGTELDALVAEKVMGYHVERFIYTYDTNSKESMVWITDVSRKNEDPSTRQDVTINPIPYSTDVASSWKIVEHIRKTSRWDCLSLFSPTDECKEWFAAFDRKWHGRDQNDVYDCIAGDTAAHAICLAALEVKNYEIG